MKKRQPTTERRKREKGELHGTLQPERGHNFFFGQFRRRRKTRASCGGGKEGIRDSFVLRK